MDDHTRPSISIPRPTSQYVGYGLIALFFLVCYGVPLIKLLLVHDPAMAGAENKGKGKPPVAGSERWHEVIVYSVFCVLPPVVLFLLVKRPICKVEPDGITIEPLRMPWDQIDYCCWGHYKPGVLNVQTRHTRHFVRVPPRLRADVETVLRAHGKWQTG